MAEQGGFSMQALQQMMQQMMQQMQQGKWKKPPEDSKKRQKKVPKKCGQSCQRQRELPRIYKRGGEKLKTTREEIKEEIRENITQVAHRIYENNMRIDALVSQVQKTLQEQTVSLEATCNTFRKECKREIVETRNKFLEHVESRWESSRKNKTTRYKGCRNMILFES